MNDTQAPKVVTIDNEQYRLIEIWVDYAWDLSDGSLGHGKRRVFALEPVLAAASPNKEAHQR